MPDTPVTIPTEKPVLPPEWREAADVAAHNLGLGKSLAELSAEHWQLVLASVTDRMLLHGATLPPGWRRALAHQVGRREATEPTETRVATLQAKREQIATHIAEGLGLGALSGLSTEERAAVEQQTTETIEGCDPTSSEPADCSDADRQTRKLLAEYRALQQRSVDERAARLTEETEVFDRQDDA
jgi:hypothetical protein